MSIEKLHMKSPCGQCPMRKDCRKGWLGSKRMKEILNSDSFVCHKDNSKQCAGHMLMLKEQNSFYRLSKRLHVPLNLKGSDLVFDNDEECVEHHKY